MHACTRIRQSVSTSAAITRASTQQTNKASTFQIFLTGLPLHLSFFPQHFVCGSPFLHPCDIAVWLEKSDVDPPGAPESTLLLLLYMILLPQKQKTITLYIMIYLLKKRHIHPSTKQTRISSLQKKQKATTNTCCGQHSLT